MEQKYRLLIVEDDIDFLDSLRSSFEDEGFYTDGATNLNKALELISRRTYHIALVDINLGGPDDSKLNRDGLEVLKRLHELDEGTKAIVLTGQDQPQFAADIVKNYQPSDYIDKGQFIKDKKQLYSKVNEQCESCNIISYGTYGKKKNKIKAIEFLSMNDPTWVANTLMLIKVKGGYNNLSIFLERFCKPFAPLMPRKHYTQIMNVVDEKRITYGEFWSKGTGTPIALVLCSDDKNKQLDDIIKENWGKELICDESSKVGIRGIIYNLLNVDRDEFMEEFPKRGLQI